MTTPDESNGWEAVARDFIQHTDKSTIGVAAVRDWCRALRPGASVLDLGCGPGTPRSRMLFDQQLTVYAVDPSPTLADEYRRRFPAAQVACEAAERSAFFGRSFDGVLAWGLLFLLPEAAQRSLIHRVARALTSHGRFLFTAPAQACTWSDLSTGRLSQSLGAGTYASLIVEAGLTLVAEYDDEGNNHYYDAVKRVSGDGDCGSLPTKRCG